MRKELSLLVAAKDATHKALFNDPDDIDLQIARDIALRRWARFDTAYNDVLRQYIDQLDGSKADV